MPYEERPAYLKPWVAEESNKKRWKGEVGVDWKQEEHLHLVLTPWSVEEIVGKRKRE